MKSTSRIFIYACICIDVFACISYHLWQIVIWTDALAMNFLQDSKVSKIHSKSQSHTTSAFTKHIYIYIRTVGNAQNIAFPRSQKMPTSKTMMAHQILKVICFPKPSRQRKTTNRHCNSKLVSNSLFSWLLVTLVTCPIMDWIVFQVFMLREMKHRWYFHPTSCALQQTWACKHQTHTHEIWSVPCWVSSGNPQNTLNVHIQKNIFSWFRVSQATSLKQNYRPKQWGQSVNLVFCFCMFVLLVRWNIVLQVLTLKYLMYLKEAPRWQF